MTLNSILSINQVYKQYQNKNVIENLNFSIHENEIVALLGVNGAGKTTTIKMMLGQVIPNSGSILLYGKNPIDPQARAQVGLTPQNVDFPEGLYTVELLKFVQAHYQAPCSVEQMIDLFQLQSFLKVKATKLSGGQKRRLALALAFIGNPNLIFLDEPTTGLDVESRKILLKTIKNFATNGKSIFLTTHYLEEIEQIATRILVLANGKIIADGSIEDIKKRANFNLSYVTFYCDSNLNLNLFPFVSSFEVENNFYSIKTTNSDIFISDLVTQKVPFKNLQIQKENLESAFIHLSKGN
ncbi:ABC transporter ATP-binding protein [Pigmentibacter ruber]|uniref:ABC transporter ATP-binding protein n=1 Tax=Pigmentibacter ruber TaxID=2683196 RepID=UPI00131CAE6B|nr:ABC transporter ATP-binding protein [Pigmentibacter ruber]BFD32498.1 ABC transporter ATP-binding protein [Pigmentibacter ruber]